MRTLPPNLAGNLAQGPVFSKDNGPSSRLSVQPSWFLTPTSSGTGAYPAHNLPIRWWQADDNHQFADEIEIPNLKSVVTDDHLNQAAGTVTIEMYNTSTPANGSSGPNSNVFGDPGHYAYAHGASSDGSSYFSSSTNSWANVLRENALIRVYQGYGGWWLSLQDAVTQGYVILKGVYLIDTVAVDSQAGLITLSGRNMAKLLLDQFVWPPTIPQSRYTAAGLIYWKTGQVDDIIPEVLGYGTNPIIAGFSWAPNGRGYRLYGSDGGVFDYGSSTFKGSMAGRTLNKPISDGDGTPSGNGYRLCGQDGGVFDFGDATFLGSLPGDNIVATDVVAIRNTTTGHGYWLVRASGGVYTFGDATYHGGIGSPSHPVVDICPTSTNNGYWLLQQDGAIFSFGDAAYHGGLNTLGSNPFPAHHAVAFDRTSTNLGYWIVTENGAVYSFGDAIYHGGVNSLTLNAPITRIRRTITGNGYDLGAADGGMFATGGDASFWGALPGDFIVPEPGTYADYSDIIKDFALWAGFYLFPHSTSGITPTGHQPQVYGNIETTGAYNTLGPLNGQIWDKLAVWDCMQKIANIVSYILRIDDQGAVRFEPYNMWQPGNFLDDGMHTVETPVFVDDVNITSYVQTTTDSSLVSEIIVGTQDPYMFAGAPPLSAIIRFTPPGISTLHGINKPAMIGIPMNVPVSVADEEIMAELLAVQCFIASRQGQLTGIYDPSVCVDDQIRIVDRSSGEADIHYVTGVHVEHDLQAGTCLATYTTYWLGNSLTWVVNSTHNTYLANSQMTATIYGNDGMVISEQLVQYLISTGAITVTQVIGSPQPYPPELGP